MGGVRGGAGRGGAGRPGSMLLPKETGGTGALKTAQTVLLTPRLPDPTSLHPAAESVLGLVLGWGHELAPPQAATVWAGGLQDPKPHSAGLLEHMDEVAGDVGLAGLVRLEVAQDAVLALAPEGCLEQLREGRQAVWVVREPELTATGPPAKREGCRPQLPPPPSPHCRQSGPYLKPGEPSLPAPGTCTV